MNNNIFEATIGFFVLSLFVFLVIFASFNRGNQISQGYEVFAYFDQADGIAIGTNLKIAGVPVGSVLGLDLDRKTFRARILLKVSKDIIIPEDSQIEVVSESLLGSKYLSLVPGSSSTKIQSGGEITQTQSSISLESLINKFLTSS